MNIYLDKVIEQEKDTLYRLLEYSLYEESLFDGNEMNNEAIFEYKYFDSYFSDANRSAFFIKDKDTNKLLGFVMINNYVQKVSNGHSIAEFMVVPKYRKNHIGKRVAFMCFNMYEGDWEVSPSFGSNDAYNFWNKVISEYTNNNFNYSEGLFSFISNGGKYENNN